MIFIAMIKNFLLEVLRRKGFFSLFFFSLLTFVIIKIFLLNSIISSLLLVVFGLVLPFFIPVHWDKSLYTSSFFQDLVSFLLVLETSFFLSPLVSFFLGFWIFVILTLLNSGHFLFCFLGYLLLFLVTFAFKVRMQILSLQELGQGNGFFSPTIEDLEGHFTLKFGVPFSFRKLAEKKSRPFYLFGGVRHMWSTLGKQTMKESGRHVVVAGLGTSTTYVVYKSDEQVERLNLKAHNFITTEEERLSIIRKRFLENGTLTPKIEHRLSTIDRNLSNASEYVQSRDIPGLRIFLRPVVHKPSYQTQKDQITRALDHMDMQSRGIPLPKFKKIPSVFEEFFWWHWFF